MSSHLDIDSDLLSLIVAIGVPTLLKLYDFISAKEYKTLLREKIQEWLKR